MTAATVSATVGRARTKPRVEPIISDTDVADVADYLERKMSGRVPAATWAAAMKRQWHVEPPNHGMMLRVDGRVTGAYVAIYSRRDAGAGTVDVCNLAAWCVDDDARHLGVRLLQRLLAQDDYEFTDLSPSGNVVALNERLGFRHLDTTTLMFAGSALRAGRRGATIVDDPAIIDQSLDAHDRVTHRDHRSSAAVRQLAVGDGNAAGLVMYRRDRRRGLPMFASIIHVSHPDLVLGSLGPLQRAIMRRERVPFVLCEARLLGGSVPRGALAVTTNRPKMHRGQRLDPAAIDNLYSELTEVPW